MDYQNILQNKSFYVLSALSLASIYMLWRARKQATIDRKVKFIKKDLLENINTNHQEHVLNLLHENKNFYPQYNGYLSNHLPMSVSAISKLGGNQHQLNEFFFNYIKRLEILKEVENPIEQPKILNETDLMENYLGKKNHYTSIMNYFTLEMNRLGKEKLVEHYLPKLFEGMIGAAFHALIQLGYGVESNDEESIVEGLSYLVFIWTPIGTLNVPNSNEEFIQPNQFTKMTIINKLNLIRSNHNLNIIFTSTAFPDRVKKVIEHQKDFEQYDLIFKLDLIQNNNEEENSILWQTVCENISDILISAYFQSNYDFFMLHGFTSWRALKVTLSFIKDYPTKYLALSYFIRAINMTYVIRGRPEIVITPTGQLSSQDLPSWDEIKSKALQKINKDSDYEHLIKLTYACFAEDADRKILPENTLFRQMAAKRIGIIN